MLRFVPGFGWGTLLGSLGGFLTAFVAVLGFGLSLIGIFRDSLRVAAWIGFLIGGFNATSFAVFPLVWACTH